ncbi:MAG: hypothetical protein Q7R66_03155 [Undibacterium sp.]|uniref:hypothetical protein n=1 Tax=Undibacterium sp. TaxID=1914977 RepID=UPI0027158924|nr:hypothetical protein [Undibacterium sp.]MDO8651171.1 hypothetical protein [Undibacterium sp.]
MDEFPFAAEFEEQMRRVKADLALGVGDVYEDCAYHPVLCIGISYEEDEIWGVSLIDGSQPRSCSLRHCGVRKLTIEEAWKIKKEWPPDAESGVETPAEN